MGVSGWNGIGGNGKGEIGEVEDYVGEVVGIREY